jgi:protein TonB
MNRLRTLSGNLSKGLSGPTKDLYVALSISIIIHVFVVYFILALPSAKPLNVESITVDFGIIKTDEGSGKANIRGKGQGLRTMGEGAGGKGEKTSINAEGAKAGSNEVRNMDNSAMEAASKNKSDIATETLSLNPFASSHIEQGSQSGMGANKGGSSSPGSVKRAGGGGAGLSGEGGEGKVYDYGYVRDAVMKNLKYPEKARRFGWEGKVVLHFVINETGSVCDVRILRSSGVQMLDEAAKDALANVAAFRNKYNRLVVVQLPIEFRLKQ